MFQNFRRFDSGRPPGSVDTEFDCCSLGKRRCSTSLIKVSISFWLDSILDLYVARRSSFRGLEVRFINLGKIIS